jgi:hypothetical protein
MLQGATLQDYMIFAAKDSVDASYLASRMGGGDSKPSPLSVLGVRMDVYLVKSDGRP